ncbi:MAG: flavin reductase family protein [Thermomicrobia bacterium]|nr:flavin reductase family protein [Thermomicrobia bacterium]
MSETIDRREFRNLVGLFATGVTVVTTRVGENVHGMTANAFTSLSLDPLLVLLCVDRRARLHPLIQEAGTFAVNFLHEGQEAISRNFAGQPQEDIADVLHFSTDEGVPVILGCLASLRCEVRQILDGGDHAIVIGHVTALIRGDVGAHPLVYFAGKYRRLLVESDAGHSAPEPWLNHDVRVYHEEWHG